MKYYLEEICDTCGNRHCQELTEEEYFERFKSGTYSAYISWNMDGLLTCIRRNIAKCKNICLITEQLSELTNKDKLDE